MVGPLSLSMLLISMAGCNCSSSNNEECRDALRDARGAWTNYSAQIEPSVNENLGSDLGASLLRLQIETRATGQAFDNLDEDRAMGRKLSFQYVEEHQKIATELYQKLSRPKGTEFDEAVAAGDVAEKACLR
ncbi:MAG: hypothetical protein HN348_29330 [Proteobacteria bacterium]|mgnify:CR=1 FL=1|jgi:hypothetical protein|nr:hypothetical protein [Pseudomonadota bacterium]